MTFSGPLEKLEGTAVIDDANYDWHGSLTAKSFKASSTAIAIEARSLLIESFLPYRPWVAAKKRPRSNLTALVV